jgi:hypothetical protein
MTTVVGQLKALFCVFLTGQKKHGNSQREELVPTPVFKLRSSFSTEMSPFEPTIAGPNELFNGPVASTESV